MFFCLFFLSLQQFLVIMVLGTVNSFSCFTVITHLHGKSNIPVSLFGQKHTPLMIIIYPRHLSLSFIPLSAVVNCQQCSCCWKNMERFPFSWREGQSWYRCQINFFQFKCMKRIVILYRDVTAVILRMWHGNKYHVAFVLYKAWSFLYLSNQPVVKQW